jgi:peptidoglycan/xylan/chitin deacetylase (PgdA/CDA1 family)
MSNTPSGNAISPAQGTLVISLDFELYWGMFDKTGLDRYKGSLLGVRSAIPQLLNLFHENDIHATWGVVGMLFFRNKDELTKGLPDKKPYYRNPQLSSYNLIRNIGFSEEDDKFHYGASLINEIASHENQEIGTHTFSHYYCLEEGQDLDTFEADLEAAKKIALTYGLDLKSLIFPRNQFNREYILACEKAGIISYRGNPTVWLYGEKKERNISFFMRALRYADTYFNLFGHNAVSTEEIRREFPFNIPASRFLYWYSGIPLIETLRLRRIKNDIAYAAKRGLVYHLWWHPHNFGQKTGRNLIFLKKVLLHYVRMKDLYGMRSMNMGELAQSLMKGNK